MGLTKDRNDAGLNKTKPDGQQEKYLVLSDEERAKGFTRPLRRSYVHTKCGTETTMGLGLCETYARDPNFYGATFCVGCKSHFPVSEFIWSEDDMPVGS
jgi:hypothetical protein